MMGNPFSIIGLYLSMFFYTATGVVDPDIFSGLIADIFNNITTYITTFITMLF